MPAEKKKNPVHDRELGMDRPISRRDFLNGAAMVIGSSAVPKSALPSSEQNFEAQNRKGYNPPAAIGSRGSHPGSFEIAHSLRDGSFWKTAGKPLDTGEAYDLIVVGAGISGLSAAYFFRERYCASARILILENHDDFGGHAKRNEFHLGGKLQLLNGGTMLIDSPTPYSSQASALLSKLGVDPAAFERNIPYAICILLWA
jgi:spermidine dehydrogenase